MVSNGSEVEISDREWPGVDLAYDLAKMSYGWALQRVDALDARIQSMQAFAASITVAFPVIVASLTEDVDFGSMWF